MTVLVFVLFTTITYHAVPMETKRAVVDTLSGQVEGVVEPTSIVDKKVEKFLNIPYGQAPIGKLRFSKPQAKKPWNGTIHNNNISIACWQYLKFPRKDVVLNEDCLVLNIWRPYPVKSNLSVMLWIHGDGFRWGYSNMYHVKNFVAVGDVILVTINYRLSVFGFLSSGDKRFRGNLGLFDQRLAMKWTKENIALFGGNPDSITIFGSSAGAVSVSAHTMSEDSWPYFDRVVLQSGSINMGFATAPKKVARTEFKNLLQLVNCQNDRNVTMCLKSESTGNTLVQLFQNSSKILDDLWLAPYTGDNDFFRGYDEDRMKETDTLIGVMKHEAFREVMHYFKESKSIDFFKNLFDEDIEEYFDNDDLDDEVFDSIIELYKADDHFNSTIEAIKPIIAFRTDSLFICPALEEVEQRAELPSNHVYFYQISHASSSSMPDFYTNQTYGFATHGLDIYSLFGYPINNDAYSIEDEILSMRMILYWTNFAKNGDPNNGVTTLPRMVNNVSALPYWPVFEDHTREYLDMVNSTHMVIRTKLREKECNMLENPGELSTPSPSTLPSQPSTEGESIETTRMVITDLTTEKQPTFEPTATATKHQTHYLTFCSILIFKILF